MKVAVIGYGAMGRLVCEELGDEVVAIIAKESPQNYISLFDYNKEIDVIIDFSNPENLDMIYDYAKLHKTKVIFATTGFNEKEINKINDLSKYTPVLRSANFSLGVILLNRLVKEITPILQDDFDIEVIEAHHNKKLDSPSGTARMLIDSIQNSKNGNLVYGRVGNSKRQKNDVGVHSLRGGTIVGDHEVKYCGIDEVITLKHEAHSKKIFVKGAIYAAKWIINKDSGLYNMENVLFD